MMLRDAREESLNVWHVVSRKENNCSLDCVIDACVCCLQQPQWRHLRKANASLHFIALMAGKETRMVHLLNGCLLAGSLRARAELCTSFHSVLRCLSRASTPPKYVAPHHSQTPSAASSHPFPPAGVRSRARTTTNQARESYETQGSCLRDERATLKSATNSSCPSIPPLITNSILTDGPSTAAADWSAPEWSARWLDERNLPLPGCQLFSGVTLTPGGKIAQKPGETISCWISEIWFSSNLLMIPRERGGERTQTEHRWWGLSHSHSNKRFVSPNTVASTDQRRRPQMSNDLCAGWR